MVSVCQRADGELGADWGLMESWVLIGATGLVYLMESWRGGGAG